MESSRLFVSNLPKHITESRLKTIFEAKGAVTDLKLVKTKEGVSRRIAFVGFKNVKDAVAARSYFNKTFVDTSRIEVDFAKAILDPNLPRAWSRHTPGSSAFDKNIPVPLPEPLVLNPKQQAFLKDIRGDDELEEFLQVMKPRKSAAQQRTWANDDVIPTATALTEDNDDEYQDLRQVPVIKEEYQVIDIPVTERVELVANHDAFDSRLSDMEYLKKKMQKQAVHTAAVETASQIHPSRLAILTGTPVPNVSKSTKGIVAETKFEPAEMEIEENEETIIEEPTSPFEEIVEEVPTIDLIADTGRLLVRNLAFSCTQDDVQELFKPFGTLNEVHIPIDKDTKTSKGYAFVLFMLPENAVNAFTDLDKSIFQGRIIDIIPAKEKPKLEEPVASGPGASSFKKKRQQETKANASSDFNWNSLFMNSDAVAEAMAKQLGVRKSEILNAESENMAVKLALAETSIINDTKDYLKEQGVSLESFHKRKTRSDLVIVVKNIPANTTQEDLVDAFGKFGNLGRVLLPPARTMAIVEFIHQTEAKVAFRRLAYSKFKNLPLYLEWAPAETFKESFAGTVIVQGESIPMERVDSESKAKEPKEELPVVEDEEQDTPVATVFVKNLNFTTKEDELKKTFEGVGGLKSARIAKKMDSKTKAILSQGFGFLEFKTKEDAMRCIKGMQKYKLDGHELLLKFSNGASSTKKDTRKRKDDDEEVKSTKLIVRNVPFEATKNELKELFTSFGHVKTCRIPRKFDGQHRGFAFIDFLTKSEAKKAYDALAATHLYGRHLVIEWANDDETVEQMREKTAKTFVATENKKRRVELGDEFDAFEE